MQKVNTNEEDGVVCFTHIPKTGGTSLDQTLFRRLFEAEDTWAPSGRRELLFDRQSCAYMPGHKPYGVHRFARADGTPQYYTMLRDPVERALSFYYECLWPRGDKKVADHPEHATAWEHDLVDFYRIPRFRNVQTRMIAGLCASYLGRYVAPDRVGLGGVVLSTAKRHLDEEYRAFGLTERFQASRHWMADTLGLEISPIEKQYKTNPERPTADELPSSKREALRRLNRLDVAFYDYALDLFDQKQGRA